MSNDPAFAGKVDNVVGLYAALQSALTPELPDRDSIRLSLLGEGHLLQW
jgi:hypothetical protein